MRWWLELPESSPRDPTHSAHFLDLTRFTLAVIAVCYLRGSPKDVVFSLRGNDGPTQFHHLSRRRGGCELKVAAQI
jgi:hypothetical protein